MQHKIISGDNHIDLTYCPTDLWSSQAPAKWKQLVPRVEERNDGQHWFCDNVDRGMWNGVGPGFLPYTKGMFDHIDEMAALGFEWNSYPGAKPRPTTPELRLADLDRDGIDKEFIYGCLMVNDLIDEAEIRNWVNARYNDWAADFAKRSDPNRVFPLAIIPNTDPKAAAEEVRRCARMGLKGGDLALQARFAAALSPGLVRGLGGLGRVQIPDLVPLDRVQGGARARQPGDGKGGLHAVAAGPLDAVPARHDGGAGLVARLRRLREIPRFQLRARRVRRDLASICVRPLRHRIRGPGAQPRLQDEAERLFPPPGLCHLPAGPVSGADRAAGWRGQHHLGRRLPAPGLHLAEFARDTGAQPRRLFETVQRKITHDNVARLYGLN